MFAVSHNPDNIARKKRKQASSTMDTLEDNASYLGIGLYTVSEVARILRAPSQSIYRWAKGYSFRSKGLLRRAAPLVDLIEMKVVRDLSSVGVKMSTIRRAAERLSAKYGTNHPFAIKELHTDGVRIFDKDFTTTEDTTYEELGRFQFVFGVMAQPFFKQIEYQDEIARYIWPIGPGRVVLDPQRGFGKPIDYKSGVPTYPLYQMRSAGESPERISRWWNVPVQAVDDAVEYEMQLAA
jgi:uncharacterized protein (DUF433 family)